MPKNVMKLLKPSRNVGRNSFDLSHRHLMTANFGELLPITCIETIPGDYIEMRCSDLLRALPMVTSPFMRVKQHIDVWFTPYDYMWHNFEAFLTMKDNPVSSSTKGFDYIPFTTKDEIAKIFAAGSAYTSSTDVVGRDYLSGAAKILDYLGYGRNASKGGVTDTSKAVNLWRILQYNKIWYDEYRQKYYDDGKRMLSSEANVAELFNMDYKDCTSVENAKVLMAQIAPKLQMRYRLWKKDLFTGVLPATQFGAVSAVGIGDLSGLSAQFVGTRGTVNVSGVNGENTQGFFTGPDAGNYASSSIPKRDSQFEPDASHNMSPSITLDSLREGETIYHYESGHFFGSFPTGDGNAFASISHDHLIGPGDIPAGSIPFSGSGNFTPQGTVNLSSTTTSAAFDILALRHAEALQIWRENALRAGNRISDNMRAHYGDDAEYDDHRSTFLGSIDAPLNIGDIDSHAQIGTGGNQQLADVAGKGLSSLDKQVFKFKAKKFGCIMVMFSLLPEAEYESQGIDGMNTLLEREDYFQSEFQNTGLKAVSLDNFYYDPNRFAETPLGYAPAYVDYKQKLDKCYSQFWADSPFSPWASPKTDIPDWIQGIQEQFVVPLSVLYINPMLYDRNFGVSVTGEPDAEATSEQVICDFYFDVSAVRAMSVVGLPQNL